MANPIYENKIYPLAHYGKWQRKVVIPSGCRRVEKGTDLIAAGFLPNLIPMVDAFFKDYPRNSCCVIENANMYSANLQVRRMAKLERYFAKEMVGIWGNDRFFSYITVANLNKRQVNVCVDIYKKEYITEHLNEFFNQYDEAVLQYFSIAERSHRIDKTHMRISIKYILDI